MRFIVRLAFLLFLPVFLYLSFHSVAAYELKDTRHVLVLHSYHQGYKWTDDIMAGIVETFRQAGDGKIKLYVEYMGTKQILDEQYYRQLKELYKHKYRNTAFDLIIASDDNAFNFLRTYRKELFSAIPVVFCGVNFFQASDLEGYPLFTGVSEDVDLKKGFDLVFELHPATTEIVVVVDSTTTGRKIYEKLLEVLPLYSRDITFILMRDNTMSQIQEKVSGLPDTGVVFYTLFFRDAEGTFSEYDESISQIAAHSTVPIYGVWDFSLGYGIVGGMLTSGYYQGVTAAGLALRILHGENAAEIPVVMKSPNRYMFDYRRLMQFNISPADLPKGSLVLNRPFSILAEYKKAIMGIIAGFVVLVGVILTLTRTIATRKKAEMALTAARDSLEATVHERTGQLTIVNDQLKAELSDRKKIETALRKSEERFRAIAESSPDAIITADSRNNIIYWNKGAERIFGYRVDEVIGKPAESLLPEEYRPKNRELFLDFMQNVARDFSGKTIEAHGVRKDGSVFPLEQSLASWHIENDWFFTSITRDISDRRQSEEEREDLIEKLQEALSEVKTLSGLLPICSACKKVRDDRGYWTQIEAYIRKHSDAEFTHGICPECKKKLYPHLFKDSE